MSGFTKLVPEIIQSSIWNEASDIRIVWITLIAIKDQDGYVRGDARTIARLANVPTEAAEIALKKFQEPDEYSHTPTDEGRRIRKADGGFTVINHGLYRSADRTEYMKTYMREYRERILAEDDGKSDSVNNSVNNVNTNVNLPSVSVSASLFASEEKGDERGGGEVEEKQKKKKRENKRGELLPFGEFGRVMLSEKENEKLSYVYGSDLQKAIDILDVYIEQKGKDSYTNHYAVLHKNGWVWEKIHCTANGKKKNSSQGNPYT